MSQHRRRFWVWERIPRGEVPGRESFPRSGSLEVTNWSAFKSFLSVLFVFLRNFELNFLNSDFQFSKKIKRAGVCRIPQQRWVLRGGGSLGGAPVLWPPQFWGSASAATDHHGHSVDFLTVKKCLLYFYHNRNEPRRLHASRVSKKARVRNKVSWISRKLHLSY